MNYEFDSALFDIVLNDSNLAIFVVNVDENLNLRFVMLNRTHEKLSGLRSEEIRGKRLEDLVPDHLSAESAAAIRERYLACVQAGKPIQYEEMLPINGKDTWWLTKLTPLKDSTGRIYQLLGTTTTINSLKQTQFKLETAQRQLQASVLEHEQNLDRIFKQHKEATQLLESQWQQFKAILENFPDVLYVVDIDTYEILLVNATLINLLGFDPVGKKCYEVLQGFKEPCDFCTNDIICQNRGKSHIWEHHNHVLDKDYLINDQMIQWPDDRDVRLEIAIDITERKRGQLKYEAIIKTTPDGFIITGPDGEVLDVNDTYVEWSGYTREQLLSMFMHELDAKYNKRLAKERSLEIRKSGTARFETQHRRKDGKPIDVEISATYSKEKDGRFYIFVRDISKQKEAEEELRKSEAKFRVIAENATDAIWQLSPALKFTYISPSVYQMTGYTPEEWIGTTLADHSTPKAFREMSKQALNALKDFKNIQNVLFESKILRKDGTEFPVEIHGRMLLNKRGLPIGLQGITRDITNRKKREEALRLAENRSKALIEHAPDGIVLVSPQGEFLYFSPSALRMFGYGPHQKLKNADKLTHPDDLPYVLQTLGQLIKDPTLVSTLQYRFLHNDGTWRWIESTFSNLLDEPAVAAIVINFHDITDSREAANALQHKVDELEKFKRLAVGRELTMIELKKEINQLCITIGKEPPYQIVGIDS